MRAWRPGLSLAGQRAPKLLLGSEARVFLCPSDTNLTTNSPLVLAAVAGMSVGIGAPILFSLAEKRDKERIEEIREINRATLKATGATLSEVRSLCATGSAKLAGQLSGASRDPSSFLHAGALIPVEG